MSESFDPYLHWLGIRDPQRPPDHYRLLGVSKYEDDPVVLSHAADRQMAHVRTFQLGEHSAASQRLLNELAAAKVCLLNPERKRAYDAKLRAEEVERRTPPPVAPPVEPLAPSLCELSNTGPVLLTPIRSSARFSDVSFSHIGATESPSSGALMLVLTLGLAALLLLGLILVFAGGGSRSNEGSPDREGRPLSRLSQSG